MSKENGQNPPPAENAEPRRKAASSRSSGHEQVTTRANSFAQVINRAFFNAFRSKALTLKKDRNLYARSFRSAIHSGLSYGPSIRNTIESVRKEGERDDGPGDPLGGLATPERDRLRVRARIAWCMYTVLIFFGLLLFNTVHGPAIIEFNMCISAIAVTLAGIHLTLRAARDYWSMTLKRRLAMLEQLKNPDDYWLPWPRRSPGKYISVFLVAVIVVAELVYIAGVR